MIATISLYHSTDKSDDTYWDIAQAEEDYNLVITSTNKVNFGGQDIFEIRGESHDLERFAQEVAGAETLEDIKEEA